MHLRKTVCFFSFFLLQSFALAGGSYYPAKIESIETEGTKFELVAVFEDSFGYDTDQCKSITVNGRYDSQKWWSYTNLINEKIHLQSLEKLKKAQKENNIVNLGFIGGGFKKIGDCKYQSKGLFHDGEDIFSIYARI